MKNSVPKDHQQFRFNFSSDIAVQILSSKTMILNTLYLNNLVFIRDFNETRDEKYIQIFMDKKEDLKNPEYSEKLNSFLVHYDIHTNESNTVLSHFVIVALYSYYERTLKHILYQGGLCSIEEKKQLYKYDNLKKFFSDKLGFEYGDLDNEEFKLLEEIRCISNCIKHSGLVSEELHAINNKWIEGEEIEVISQEDIAKFIDIPHLYMSTIVNKIKTYYFGEKLLEVKENNNKIV